MNYEDLRNKAQIVRQMADLIVNALPEGDEQRVVFERIRSDADAAYTKFDSLAANNG